MAHESYNFKDYHHGKLADHNPPHIHNEKCACKVEGHVNPYELRHDAKGHAAGHNAGDKNKF